MRWPWISRRKCDEALQTYAWEMQNQRLDGASLIHNAIRTLDPWHTFRHGPVDKDAMRGPIPPSASSIRELYHADLEARRCGCGNTTKPVYCYGPTYRCPTCWKPL